MKFLKTNRGKAIRIFLKLISVTLCIALCFTLFFGAIPAAAVGEDGNFFEDATMTVSRKIVGEVSYLNDGHKSWSGSENNIACGYDGDYAYYEAVLREESTLSSVRVCLFNGVPNERPCDIAIDLKTADGRWIRAAERHNIQYDNSTWQSEVKNGVQTVFLPFNFTATECIAVRITANRLRTLDTFASSGNFRVVELEAYYNENQGGITGTSPDANERYNIPYIASPDYAHGKTVTATPGLSNGSTTDAATIASRLVYLTSGHTGWADPYYFDTQADPSNLANLYFNVDLDGTYVINYVKLSLFVEAGSPAKRDPRDMAVDVKLPNGVWKRVVEQHDMVYDVSTTRSIPLDFVFEPVEATQVRITFNRTNISNYNNNRVLVSPDEIYVYFDQNKQTLSGIQSVASSSPTYMPIATSDNLIENATVSANNALNSYPATNLKDGVTRFDDGNLPDAITSYNSDGYAWYQADFDNLIPVSQIKMYLSNLESTARSKDMAVDVLLESGNWQRVAERHNIAYADGDWTIESNASGGLKVGYSFNFSPVYCRAVRLTANRARNSSSNFRLREMEIYCNFAQGSLTGTEKDANDLYNIPDGPWFASHQLVLGSKIGIKFFVDLNYISPAAREASYMEFTVSGATETVPFKDAVYNAGKYVFTCYVSAGQMAETVDAVYHYGDKSTVEDDYSVKEYVTWANGALDAGTTRNLVNAMSDYGYFATVYLNALHGNSYDNFAAVTAYTDEQIESKLSTLGTLGVTTTKTLNADIASITYKLTLDTETTLKVYMNLRDGYTGTFTASATDGVTTYTAKRQSAGKYVIEIPGLKVQDLNKKFSISGTTDTGAFSLTNLSALTYVRTALKTTDAGQQNLRNAMAGLYDYYTSALDYLG